MSFRFPGMQARTGRLPLAYSLLPGILLLTCPLCPAQDLNLTPLHESIEKYGKAEFQISLDREYANPFDQFEVDLTLILETPSRRRLTVPAFYVQPCERRTIDRPRGSQQWIYPVGKPQWRARFAPAEVGTYRAAARLIDRQGTVVSQVVTFAATDSENRGFLRTSSQDPRYLAFDNGDLFFPVGQNLAFVGPGQPITLSRAQMAFTKLAQNGANFVRIWTGCQDWALAIESPRSAWGRSWSKNHSIAILPKHEGLNAVRIGGLAGGQVTATPYDAIPVRPDSEYRLTGNLIFDGATELRIAPIRSQEDALVVRPNDAPKQSFQHTFRTDRNQYYLDQITLAAAGDGMVWLTNLSLKEAIGGPELLPDADPNLPRRGIYHQIDAFTLDQLVESARDNGIYLQLCVTMRDLYMDRLKDPRSNEYDQAIRDARNLMRYFVARWGYSTGVAVWEYFNEMNPGQPTDRFYTELAQYLDRVDPYGHPRTTSTWSTSHRDWRHPRLDIAQEHHYLRPSTLDKNPDVVTAVLDRARDLREHAPNRPIFLAEFGLADEKWGTQPTHERRSAPRALPQRALGFHPVRPLGNRHVLVVGTTRPSRRVPSLQAPLGLPEDRPLRLRQTRTGRRRGCLP